MGEEEEEKGVEGGGRRERNCRKDKAVDLVSRVLTNVRLWVIDGRKEREEGKDRSAFYVPGLVSTFLTLAARAGGPRANDALSASPGCLLGVNALTGVEFLLSKKGSGFFSPFLNDREG